jgi:hypothetical protein
MGHAPTRGADKLPNKASGVATGRRRRPPPRPASGSMSLWGQIRHRRRPNAVSGSRHDQASSQQCVLRPARVISDRRSQRCARGVESSARRRCGRGVESSARRRCSAIAPLALDLAASIRGATGAGSDVGAELVLELLPPVSAQLGWCPASTPAREQNVSAEKSAGNDDKDDCPEHRVNLGRSAAEPAASRDPLGGLALALVRGEGLALGHVEMVDDPLGGDLADHQAGHREHHVGTGAGEDQPARGRRRED